MILKDCSSIILGDDTYIRKIYLGEDSNLLYPSMNGYDFKISIPVERTKGDIYCIGNADGFLKSWAYGGGKRTTIYSNNIRYDDILKIKLADNDYFNFNCNRDAKKWYDLNGNEVFSNYFACDRGYPHLVDDNDEDAYYELYSNSLSDNVERLDYGGKSENGYHLMYLYKVEKI